MQSRTTQQLVGIIVLLLVASHARPALAAACGGSTPCSCGDTVTADRTLVTGIDPVTTDVCPGLGLRVIAGVTLHLGGSTIRGQAGHNGIELDGTGAAVWKGRILGFGTGVRAVSLGAYTVSMLRITVVGGFAIRLEGDGGTVHRNVVRNGAIFVSGTDNVVSSNRVSDVTPGTGMFVQGSLNQILRNRVSGSPGGISIVDGDLVVVEMNRATSNTGHGFDLVSGTQVRVSRNTATRNGGNGFQVSRATDSLLSHNVSRGNGAFGVRDLTTGGGTAGTANTHESNRCDANTLGDSDPPGLCS